MLSSALLLGLLTLAPASASQDPAAAPAPNECADWEDCRQHTTDALAAGEFETAHDLAWRAVQKGPKDDPALLYLLARAQCLSGRPDDALVMLRRIADSGVATEAVTDADFRRTRELSGWPGVEALLTAAARTSDEADAPHAPDVANVRDAPETADAPETPDVPDVPPAAPEVEVSAPTAADSDASPTNVPEGPAVIVEEAARFTTSRFTAGGLAYDAVSGRFLFGDLDGRKLMVAQDGIHHAVDYVRSESAGFYQVMGIEIDVPRGDLWVASADRARGAARLHKLQLVSGRPLEAFDAPVDIEPVELVDLAVGPDGTVVAVDARGGRLLKLEAGADALVVVGKVRIDAPASVAWARSGAVVYVAGKDGVRRVDVATRRMSELSAPEAVSLGGFERIRRHRNELVGIQRAPDGSRRVVRLRLNRSGRAVTAVTVVDVDMPQGDGPVFATVSGDELSYWIDADDEDAPSGQTEVVVYRVPLD